MSTAKMIKSVAVLVAICTVIGILLGITNAITAPFIEANQAAKENGALLEVLPTGKNFAKCDLAEFEGLPETVREIYTEENGGYVVKLETTGYGTGMIIMCGINADLTVAGTKCISSNETLGYEKTYGENLVGKDIETVGEVDTIAGATKTTGAYRSAVKDAIGAAIIVGGGSVDLRTEEEILRDNLSAALPAANGEFEKVFLYKELTVASAYYKATNGAGFVALVENEGAEGEDAATELFYAADAEGVFAADAPEGLNEELAAQLAVTFTTISKSDYTGISSSVRSIKLTDSGTYLLELRAAGYGINGEEDEYHEISHEYIIIRVCISADGKIIDCLTVSQAETEGVGDACANEKFYGQFDGKTQENYTEIDGIGGATITTDGYMAAILTGFKTVEILTAGGNE